ENSGATTPAGTATQVSTSENFGGFSVHAQYFAEQGGGDVRPGDGGGHHCAGQIVRGDGGQTGRTGGFGKNPERGQRGTHRREHLRIVHDHHVVDEQTHTFHRCGDRCGDCHPLCEGVRLFGPWRGVTPPRGHHVRRTLCTHPDDVGVRGMLLDPPGHAGDQRPVTDRQYDRVDLTGGRQFNTDGACTFGDTRVSAVLHKNSVLLRSGEFAGGIVGAAIGDLVYACAQGSHPGQFHRSDAR